MGEILHSGEYWQMLRRRRKERLEREARQGGHPSRYSDGDGAAVYTFIPGRAAPLIGVQVASGSVSCGQPATSTSTSHPTLPRPRKKTRPVVTTNSILASRARDDEILLARLQTSHESGLKRKPQSSSSHSQDCAPRVSKKQKRSN